MFNSPAYFTNLCTNCPKVELALISSAGINKYRQSLKPFARPQREAAS